MWSMSHVLGHMWLPSSPVLRLASENSHSAGGWRETCRVWQTAQCAAATQTGHLVPQYVSARMAHELLPPAPWSGLSPRGSQELRSPVLCLLTARPRERRERILSSPRPAGPHTENTRSAQVSARKTGQSVAGSVFHSLVI